MAAPSSRAGWRRNPRSKIHKNLGAVFDVQLTAHTLNGGVQNHDWIVIQITLLLTSTETVNWLVKYLRE